MHGTETPAQPNDPPNFDFPQPDGHFFGEIDQNLDFDARMESGQWRKVHQVHKAFFIECHEIYLFFILYFIKKNSIRLEKVIMMCKEPLRPMIKPIRHA